MTKEELIEIIKHNSPEEAAHEILKLSLNVPVSRSFHGRDEEDSAVIEEAKKIWTTEHQGKLKAVKHLMGSRLGFESCTRLLP